MPKITPFLWFDDNAEEAVNFYLSVFKEGNILNTARYGEGSPGTPGSVMSITFELHGQVLTALNGGPHFKFSEAISFFVTCKDQAEVDWYWNNLCEGGTESQCGWLKDKYGLSWQIVPEALGTFLGGPDPAGAERAMQAMLQMKKLDITALERAYNGE